MSHGKNNNSDKNSSVHYIPCPGLPPGPVQKSEESTVISRLGSPEENLSVSEMVPTKWSFWSMNTVSFVRMSLLRRGWRRCCIPRQPQSDHSLKPKKKQNKNKKKRHQGSMLLLQSASCPAATNKIIHQYHLCVVKRTRSHPLLASGLFFILRASYYCVIIHKVKGSLVQEVSFNIFSNQEFHGEKIRDLVDWLSTSRSWVQVSSEESFF